MNKSIYMTPYMSKCITHTIDGYIKHQPMDYIFFYIIKSFEKLTDGLHNLSNHVGFLTKF